MYVVLTVFQGAVLEVASLKDQQIINSSLCACMFPHIHISSPNLPFII